MAYGQVMACLLKLTPRNMFIALGKSCGENACIYLFIYYYCYYYYFTWRACFTLTLHIRFQNPELWNLEIWNPDPANNNIEFHQQGICAILNPRLSWTTLRGLSLRLQVWDLILSPCLTVCGCPSFLRAPPPPLSSWLHHSPPSHVLDVLWL